MTIYASINDRNMDTITLPSGYYFDYQLIEPDPFSDQHELVLFKTDIPELIAIYRAGNSYYLNKFGDSIILEGTKIVFN